MQRLQSYLLGTWQAGDGDPTTLVNPATEAGLAQIYPSGGLHDALAFARTVGGPNLRALSFAERGQRLASLAKLLHGAREELIDIAIANGGNTRGDAKFDIDGAISVLAEYASVAQGLGTGGFVLEQEPVPVHKGSKIRAQHILSPRLGVAIHINAFNFPAWGMIGKFAVAMLAGVPVLTKPATSTAMLAARIATLMVESDLIPQGAFSLLLGPVGDLLDHVGPQDLIAFTGSADTGQRIRGHRRVLATNVRVNIEADSLNAVVIGPDVAAGTELFDLVIRDCVVELTQKAGQKCTATRRILVPTELLAQLREALIERLSDIAGKTGDPRDESVRMGPLSSSAQLVDARNGLQLLSRHAEHVFGSPDRTQFVAAKPGVGYFLEPQLLEASAAAARDAASSFHHHEVFGPVATLLPYDGTVNSAATIVGHGHGSLVGTVYSDDREFTHQAVLDLAPLLGRLVLASEKSAAASMAPGCVFPVCHHGGPGRAGAGSELGGRSGLDFYWQRTTLQGGAADLARLLKPEPSKGETSS